MRRGTSVTEVGAMTRIRARCPVCGDVELAPESMMVEVSHDAHDLVAADSTYRFVCPYCTDTVRKPADERIVQLLISGGVPLEISADLVTADLIAPPHETARGEADTDAPPLTFDDLLDLHLLLCRDDWFDELEQLTG